MKKAITLLAFLIFYLSSWGTEVINIKGSVTCEERPLSGVVVTDGVNFSVTDKKGRYSINSPAESRFVYISTPAGYSAPVKDGVINFFIKIDDPKKRYDFSLTKKTQDDNQHAFIAIADPQIWSKKEFTVLDSAAADIRSTIKEHPASMPFHGICCGDIVSNDHSFYPLYTQTINKSGIPFYNTMGNHDMVNYGRSFETSQGKYEETFGPSYYSYNVGRVHYVVLNDNFYIGRDYFYIGYLEEKQLSWLERDLAFVKSGSTVVVALHIPSSCEPKDRKQFSYERAGGTMTNHRGLYKILEPFNAHIISGHTHTAYNQQIAPRLYEHVTPALSGAWWQGELCTDGTPRGYGVYEVSGDSISWYYKSTGYPKDYQIKTYNGEDYPEFKGYVVANIWNSDPSWRVELYEDGRNMGPMERFEAYDPSARQLYSNTDKLDHKWIYPSLSDHFYRAKPSGTAGKTEIVATDHFGNRYTQEVKSEYDVVVIGGGNSGTAAGIQAARSGVRTLITEEYDWLGGMITAAGVSAFDGNFKLKGGFWGEFRDSLSNYYGGDGALKTGWVSNILFEPSVGNKIFKKMAQRERNLNIWYRSVPVSFKREDGKWEIVINSDGRLRRVFARVLIDATELGDVAKELGVRYDIGMDSRHITGEDIAPAEENDIIQDLTYVMILKEYDRDMTIAKPEGYNPALFYCSCISDKCKHPKEKQRLWSKEMMITYGKLPNKKYMINWPIEGNDYYVNVLEMGPKQREEALQKAKNHSLSFLYYMQTELGFKNLGLADDEYPTADKLPFMPYHRESRRIDGVVRFTVKDVSDPYGQKQKLYRTSVAVGDYPVDHHHTRYSGWAELPDLHFHPVPSYGLPLGVMIPKEVKGLIVAEKTISVTNLVNGSTRLQPVVMQIGFAAGSLAAIAVKEGKDVSEISIREVQKSVLSSGGYLLPYLDLPSAHNHFKALQRIGVTGIIKGVGMNKGWENQTWFRADSLISDKELSQGLSEVYPEKRFDDASEQKTSVKSLSKMLSAIEGSITPSEMEKRINGEWAKLELGIFDTNRPLTRGECAVIIDRFADPFNNAEVDIFGNYIKMKK